MTARVNLYAIARAFLPVSLTIVASALFLFSQVTITAAFENPQLYYDWYDRPSFTQVLGAEDSQTEPSQNEADFRDYDQFNYFFKALANLNPDQPFYRFKRIEEGISLTFTFNPKLREEKRLQIAGQRLAELETMLQQGKVEFLSSLAKDYQQALTVLTNNLQRLQTQGQDLGNLASTVDLEAAKHTLVLEKVALMVPPAAEAGLQTALTASSTTADTIADLQGRPAMPSEIVQRLQSLKAQGILTSEEVTKLIGVKSRVEARMEMRKYTDNRLIPEADFQKFDETSRYYFPTAYYQTLEIKKFMELRDLESEKPDEETLKKLQDFAQTYQQGEVVPAELRRFWVPLVRLEELQNTIRPDLIDEDTFRYRPDHQQKYREIVERVKPRPEDVVYLNKLVTENPALLSDPAYARLKAIGDKFGAACPPGLVWIQKVGVGGFCGRSEESTSTLIEGFEPVSDQFCLQVITSAKGPDGSCGVFPNSCLPKGWSAVGSCVIEKQSETDTTARACNRGSHWVNIPFMPEGGYCVPNYDYPIIVQTCPPGYHRTSAESSCYPDNVNGSGVRNLPAPGTCPADYEWKVDKASPQGGFCSPRYPTSGGGYPQPFPVPFYCPPSQRFVDGKCEPYQAPPKEGCPEGQFWSGSRCVAPKDCPAGHYQDANGECKKGEYESGGGPPVIPPIGEGPKISCPPGYRLVPAPQTGMQCQREEPIAPYPTGTTSTSGTGGTGTGGTPPPSQPGQPPTFYGGSGGYGSYSCTPPSTGCASGYYWDQGMCMCKPSGSSGYTQPSGSNYQPPPSGSYSTGGNQSCGSGYYWNGSYCARSGGESYTPPPSYPSGSSGSYTPPPSYTPPSYSQPSTSTPPPSTETAPPPPPSSESQPPQSSEGSSGESAPPPSSGGESSPPLP